MRFTCILFLYFIQFFVPALAQTDSSAWRPALHFTPSKNWINDPNGLIYHGGQYHLFYQHNPFENKWGHMTWGHAVSKDLIKWDHLPIAIPEEGPTMIFSGSVVADPNNTCGLCTNPTGCLVALYTGHQSANQSQHVAVSNDGGLTWKKYAQNPVLDLNKKDFRDPNVFWHAASAQWVMSLVLPDEHKVQLYGSKNLLKWSLLSEFGNAGDRRKIWECPALLELPIEKETGKSKWVLLISASNPTDGFVGMQYFVGDFDGKTFKNENSPETVLWLDYGKDFYAAIPWNDVPNKRKIIMGWMNNWAYAAQMPTPTWNGQMNIPREISLRRTEGRLRIVQKPVEELYKKLSKLSIVPKTFVEIKNEEMDLKEVIPIDQNVYELQVDFQMDTATGFGVKLAQNEAGQQTVVGYDPANQRLYVDRTQSGQRVSDNFLTRDEAPLKAKNGKVALKILVDKCSVEVFANDGEVVLSSLIFPDPTSTRLSLFATNGTVKLAHVAMRRLDKKATLK